MNSCMSPMRLNHLSSVRPEHLSKLRGYKLLFKAEPNGACLENSVVHEDKKEGSNFKRRVNNHIADNWENYYKFKIPLPYEERVGVGKNSKDVRKETKEEMINFLRSDESLTVYSNSQELLAVANLYNVNIDIFTYGDSAGDGWKQVCPDPVMAADAEAKLGKFIPDIALYNSYNNHYDLLVKEDSRLALLGFLAGAHDGDAAEREDQLEVDKEVVLDAKNSEITNISKENNWQKVKSKNKKTKQNIEDVILEDIGSDNENEKDIHEEVILLEGKNSGHRRTSPQEISATSKKKQIYGCDQCETKLESQGLLNSHISSQHTSVSNNNCQICSQVFKLKKDLDVHIEKHSAEKFSEE